MQGNDTIKYATSILDYVFRELAVSYFERFDLAHVDPTDAGFDALGKGVEEGKPPRPTKYVSKGLTRSRTDKLSVLPGGAAGETRGQGDTRAAALRREGVRQRREPRAEVSGTAALKADSELRLSPAASSSKQLPLTRAEARAAACREACRSQGQRLRG